MPPFDEKAERVKLVPIVAPPEKVEAVEVVAPRPVTDESVSDSEVIPPAVEEIVIVEPDCEIDVLPDPASVMPPAKLFTPVTKPVVLRLTVGVWPPVTEMPVPPVRL